MALFAAGAATALLWLAFALWIPLFPNVFVPLLDLGKLTGYTWPAALRFLGLVLALYAVYALGYFMVRRGTTPTGIVFALAALFCVPLGWTYPATAVDVFGYVAHGRLLATHGLNPFVVPPGRVVDAVLPYLAFPTEPSQYGPVWVLLGGAIATLANGDLLREVVLYKVLAALAHLAGGFLVLQVAARLGASARAAQASAYLFLWNPLLLWEMVGNAHNDGLMVLGFLAAAWLLIEGRDRLVLPALTLGALVKVPIAVVAPILAIFTWRRRRSATVEGALLSIALAFVLYRPFWEGTGTLTALQRSDLFTASLGTVVRQTLAPVIGTPEATFVARWLTLGLFGLVMVVILWRSTRAWTALDVLRLCYIALLAALLLGITWFQAWYVVWPFAAGAILASGRRHLEAALLSLGAMLSYFVFIYLWVMRVLPSTQTAIQATAYLAIVGPLLLGWIVMSWRGSKVSLAP